MPAPAVIIPLLTACIADVVKGFIGDEAKQKHIAFNSSLWILVTTICWIYVGYGLLYYDIMEETEVIVAASTATLWCLYCTYLGFQDTSAEEMFEKMDSNSSGYIDWDEFRRYFCDFNKDFEPLVESAFGFNPNALVDESVRDEKLRSIFSEVTSVGANTKLQGLKFDLEQWRFVIQAKSQQDEKAKSKRRIWFLAVVAILLVCVMVHFLSTPATLSLEIDTNVDAAIEDKAAMANVTSNVGANELEKLALKNTTMLFVGNPGAGKSTLANRMAGDILFLASSDTSGSGVTNHLEYKLSKDGREYADTPGLSDTKKREIAAWEISTALRRGGRHQICFVVTENANRVLLQDVATISLVLQAAPEIGSRYAILVNMCPKHTLKKAAMPSWRRAFLASLTDSIPERQRSQHIYFERRIEELEGEENVIVPLDQGLHDFLQGIPQVDLTVDKASYINATAFDEKLKILEVRLDEMEAKLKKAEKDLAASKAKEAEADREKKQADELKKRLKYAEDGLRVSNLELERAVRRSREVLWETTNGYIDTSELHKNQTTITAAKIHCKIIKQCKGFYFQWDTKGEGAVPSNKTLEITFVGSHSNRRNGWHKYTSILMHEGENERQNFDFDWWSCWWILIIIFLLAAACGDESMKKTHESKDTNRKRTNRKASKT